MNIEYLGRSRVEQEGGTNLEPTVRRFTFNRETDGKTIAAQVVQDRVMASLAEQEGMVVSPEVVNDYLREIGLGRVEDTEIQQILTGVGRYKNLATSETVLFDGLRELLLANNYMASLSTSLEGADPSLVWNDWLALNNRVKLQAAILPAEKFLSAVEEPSDVQLVDFYEQHKNQVAGGRVARWGMEFNSPNPGFRKARTVKLKFLLGDVSSWTEKMLDEVTDEEIADYYERNKRTQFVKFDPIFENGGSGGVLDEIFKNEDDSEEDSKEDASGAEEEASAADTESAEASEDDSTESEEEAAEESEEPAAEDSGAVAKPSPFRLTAVETNASDEESAEGEDASEEEDESAEEDSEASTDAETDKETEESEADSDEERYEPLENVRDQIRRSLATDKAVQELAKVTESAYGKLTSVYNRYGGELVAAQADEKDPPAVPKELTNLSPLAEELGLYYEETVALSPSELSETSVGKAVDAQTASNPVWRMAFTTLKLHEPTLAVDIDGYRYVVIKVEDTASEVPSFEDCREDVIDAWKQAEAKRLAEEKGEEIAKQATEDGASLVSAVGDQSYEVVTTDFFSRFSFGSTQADMRRGPRLSEVPPLEQIGDDFLIRIFSMDDDDVLALPNFDRSATYVVKIDQKEMTEEEMQRSFLETVNNSRAIQVMTAMRNQRIQQALITQIFQTAQLDTQRLQQFLQGPAE